MVNRERSGVAVGFISFAGIVLILAGIFHVIDGIVGLFNNDFYVKTENWVFKLNVSSWGWIHILLGIVAILAGVGLFSGAIWARTVAVIVAAVSIIANFVWLPYYPWWAVLVIVLDFFVIWAVVLHGRDVTAE
jgi:hypothetical protein